MQQIISISVIKFSKITLFFGYEIARFFNFQFYQNTENPSKASLSLCAAANEDPTRPEGTSLFISRVRSAR